MVEFWLRDMFSPHQQFNKMNSHKTSTAQNLRNMTDYIVDLHQKALLEMMKHLIFEVYNWYWKMRGLMSGALWGSWSGVTGKSHFSELYMWLEQIMVVPIHCLESFPFESDCQGSKFNILLFSSKFAFPSC